MTYDEAIEYWCSMGRSDPEAVSAVTDEVERLRQALGGDPNCASDASTDLEYWQRKSRDNFDAWVGASDELKEVRAERDRLRAERDTPHTTDFLAAVKLEALHQRERWGADHDVGKTDADWFWLVGYLAGKALTAAGVGNFEKALHHTISTAAALMNWHAALSGVDARMRPGIDAAAKGVAE